MNKKQLGRTDMDVSHLSFGGAAFSNFYRPFEEERGIELLQTCFQRGINYIDTGPWYGQGSSEVTCGKALQGVPRQSFYIGGKVGRYELDVKNMFDFSADKTHASVELSLKRLGLDYVDIIQVHDPTFAPDISVVLRETLPALAKEVERGRARYIGLADYDLQLLKEVIEESEVAISTILSYAKCTMIDQRLAKYADFFKGNGVGVINASGTGMGLLTNAGPPPWHPASDDIKNVCAQASAYCKENGVELARLATWFSFGHTCADTHIMGIQNLKQLEETESIYIHGLTDHEKKVLEVVQERFFKDKSMHWDNVELPAYREKMAKFCSEN